MQRCLAPRVRDEVMVVRVCERAKVPDEGECETTESVKRVKKSVTEPTHIRSEKREREREYKVLHSRCLERTNKR